MKILSKPATVAEWKMENTCNNCQTKVELQLQDFKTYVSDQRDGDAVTYECPTCNKLVWLDAKCVPQWMRKMIGTFR